MLLMFEEGQQKVLIGKYSRLRINYIHRVLETYLIGASVVLPNVTPAHRKAFSQCFLEVILWLIWINNILLLWVFENCIMRTMCFLMLKTRVNNVLLQYF